MAHRLEGLTWGRSRHLGFRTIAYHAVFTFSLFPSPLPFSPPLSPSFPSLFPSPLPSSSLLLPFLLSPISDPLPFLSFPLFSIPFSLSSFTPFLLSPSLAKLELSIQPRLALSLRQSFCLGHLSVYLYIPLYFYFKQNACLVVKLGIRKWEVFLSKAFSSYLSGVFLFAYFVFVFTFVLLTCF